MFNNTYTYETKFSSNHNGKFFLKCFPTVRIHNKNKYYKTAKHLIKLNDVEIGIAEIIAVRQFSFGHINENLTWIDAAMTQDKYKAMIINMYSNKIEINNTSAFDHVVFRWIEYHIKNFTELANNHFEKLIATELQNQSVNNQNSILYA